MNKNIDIKNIKIAKRYSHALAQSAEGNIDEILENLKAINDAIFENQDLKTFFLHPVISLKDKKEAIKTALENKINILTLNFIETLLDENRFVIFKTIYELFKKEADAIKNKQEIEIISAVDIEKNLKEQLEEKLRKKLNKDVILNYTQNQNIIGGFIIKIEDKIIDLSLKTKFETLKKY